MRVKLLKIHSYDWESDSEWIRKTDILDEVPWKEVSEKEYDALREWVNDGRNRRNHLLIVEEPSLFERALEEGQKIIQIRDAVRATKKPQKTKEEKERTQYEKLKKKFDA